MTQQFKMLNVHMLATERQSILEKKIEQAILRFPHFFDKHLYKGLEQLIVNSPQDFLTSRSLIHLQSLLLTQFFLQKKIVASLQHKNAMQNQLFLKIFQYPSRICVALIFFDSYSFQREQLLKTMQMLLPGIQEIPRSFYLWHHSELPYIFCYLEVNKLRGDELTMKDLKKIERALQEQLYATTPLTPALFWPYNEEESFRQIQFLKKEMRGKQDMPHVSIHFQEQTSASLEFLIHLARPKSSESLTRSLERLPDYLDFFCHFQHSIKIPFPLELGVFAVKVPAHVFDVRDSINLLYARRYVLKHLETTLGPCRDCNGGLFEKQQQHFETIRVLLSDKIPLFELFAEKVFYALHPVERRLTLSLKDAKDLFSAFSDLMQGKEPMAGNYYSENVMIVKAANSSDLPRLSYITKESKKRGAHARLNFGGFYYHCVLGPKITDAKSLIQQSSHSQQKTKILRLAFEEGKPTTLNPYHSAGDMRCRILSKLLFEGLIRLNAQGKPEVAGAVSYDISNQGILYTFKLRPNRWSNGERVTAIDYVMSLQRALRNLINHPEIHFIIKNAQSFKEKKLDAHALGIRALDSDTLQIELEYPHPSFLYQLARPLFFPLFGSKQEPKWFNGPFLVREQNKEGIFLERNPYFWNTKSLFFDEIEIRWIHDSEKIDDLFQEGKVNWRGDPLTSLSMFQIQQLEKEKKLYQQVNNRYCSVFFNTKHPVLSSHWIRRAFSLAIDRALICHTICPYSTPLFSSLVSKEEANACFDQGLKELGLTRKNFPALTFTYSHQARRETLALCLQSVWQKLLDINVCLEKIEWNLFRNRLERGIFEIGIILQDNPEEDSPRFLERFEGSNSWNFSRWKNLNYRKLIAKAKVETDAKQCQILISQAKQILVQEVPFAPLFKYQHLYTHVSSLRGYLFDEEGCVDFSQAYFT